MNNQEEILGTGAIDSVQDPRTVQFDIAFAGEQLVKGGTEYSPNDIEHQHVVGICTAISRVQLRQKQTGKKYSPDFQYLLQKKFMDGAWYEGSSLLHSNKIAKKYGFLPAHLWTHTTENDRYLPYSQYIAKLQAIPDAEIYRLIDLCVDPIAGYAAVNVFDAQAVAKAINESVKGAGILCRYDCGKTWWTNKKGVSSWNPKDIQPLRKPIPATSGHAIIMSRFDYTDTLMQRLANTWGITWCEKGSCDIDWSNYKMTEAWVDLETAPVVKYFFSKVLKYDPKKSSEDVKQLQLILTKNGYQCGLADGVFGRKTLSAVMAFQQSKKLKADGIVGAMTNIELNKLS